ncbi:MAG: YraN family protein [Planctomycetes bacterium]|nr:YraN family protein [Planctomycetota bacterium]
MSGPLARLARAALRRVAPRAFLALCPRAGSDELGRAGEELVARALHRAGARIEARRLRTPWGELDLLARDALGLLAVEVKTARLAPRPRPRGEPPVPLAAGRRPGARVDGRGRVRLERIARGLAARRRVPVRAEVWEVLAGPGRATLAVRRVADA